MKPAIFLVGHGTRDPEGSAEFLRLVEMLRARDTAQIVEYGFLEHAEPSIAEGLGRCVDLGAHAITVVPCILLAAGHAKKDIPRAIAEARARHPHALFHYGAHLYPHAKIIELCKIRIDHAAPSVERPRSALIVVGRGSSAAEANAEVHALGQLLGDSMGFAWASACFAGVATPSLADALRCCQEMGFGRLLVFPFLLFTGVLEKQIRHSVADFGACHAQTEVRCAGYLGAHPLLCDVCLERAGGPEAALADVHEQPDSL